MLLISETVVLQKIYDWFGWLMICSLHNLNNQLQPLTSKTDYNFHFCKRQSEQQKTGAHSLKFSCVLRFDLMV